LQYSASRLIITAPLWSNGTTEQVIGRLWRTGQRSPVTVTTVLIPDSIEARVADRVQEKKGWHSLLQGL
jgi:SNF2 family DNA or RNA helicase